MPYRALYNRLFPPFYRPIRQHATGRQGLYRTLLVEQRSVNLPTFKAMTEEPTNAPPSEDPETLERKFWKNIPMNPPLYGADVPGSLFDERVRGWNLKRLKSILSQTLEDNDAVIPGVTQPYLYAGSWRSFFAWHTEDLDLHSVNYIHTGAPKTWYVIPPAARERFELTARDLLPELSRSCPEFLRHKEIMLSPALLAAHNIPVVRAVHNAREFVVVGPGAYHAGFNHGFNLAESVNFATKAWIPVGARASFCTCRSDSVKIDMRLFIDEMDAELAEEVLESYRSDSEEEEEEEEESEEEIEEEEDEDAEEEEVEEVVESEEEEEVSSSEDESDSEEEEEEELPAKRVRKPTAKAMANGMAPNWKPTEKKKKLSSSSSLLSKKRGGKQNSKVKPHVHSKGCSHHTNSTKRVSPTNSGSKQKAALRKTATRRKLATASATASEKSAAAAAQRKQRKQRAEAALRAAAVHASSSDDEATGSRHGSKRGAALKWYRLFDSLLPALKRARA
jgi:jumonji domain-containing protein 2